MVGVAIILVVSICLKLLIANAQMAGSISGAFSTETFKWIWRPNAAQTLMFFWGVLFLVFVAKLRWRPGGMIAALFLASGFGLAGHSQSLDMPMLWTFIIAIHVLIAGFWFAAPGSLFPRADVGLGDLAEKAARFSQVAIWIIPVLVGSGLWSCGSFWKVQVILSRPAMDDCFY